MFYCVSQYLLQHLCLVAKSVGNLSQLWQSFRHVMQGNFNFQNERMDSAPFALSESNAHKSGNIAAPLPKNAASHR